MKKKPAENSPAAARKRKNVADNEARRLENMRRLVKLDPLDRATGRPSKAIRTAVRAERRADAARKAAAIASLSTAAKAVSDTITEIGETFATGAAGISNVSAALSAPVE